MKETSFSIKIKRIFSQSKEFVREGMIHLEGDLSLSSLMTRFSHKIVSLSLRVSLKKTVNRIRLFHRFGKYLIVMNKRHGSLFVVKYLKAASLAISKVLAGEPLVSLRELEPDLPLPRLSKSGLPVIIGTRDRRSIVSLSHRVVRMYLSLFSLYRVIKVEGELKTKTITDPYSGDPLFLDILGRWLEKSQLLDEFRRERDISSNNYLIRETASPTNSRSWIGLIRDAVLILNDNEIYEGFKAYCRATNSNLISVLDKFNLVPLSEVCLLPSKLLGKGAWYGDIRWLGQLKPKVEPAGKVRVFAIVDGWTQSLFSPLHKNLAGILSRMPNDGTFDQDAARRRCREKAVKYNCAFGYDLSAATDRLPIKLQVDILAGLFGRDTAEAWAKVLVSRDYHLFPERVKGSPNSPTPFRYAVGQPMGALSSWPMLAITHHMIVQYCSFQINPRKRGWETRYEVLGDDINIFDEKLANKYLWVMEKIGVPINLSKSVVSRNRPVVEFAKATSIGLVDVSPLSFKQFISQDTFRGRINTFMSLIQKDSSFLNAPMSVFYTVLSQSLRDKRPRTDHVSVLALMNGYFANKHYLSYLMSFVDVFRPTIVKGKFTFLNLNISLCEEILSSLWNKSRLPNPPRTTKSSVILEWSVKQVILGRLARMERRYTDDWVERQVARHIEACFGSLREYHPEIARNLNFIVRNIFFTHRINSLTLWNHAILRDPKVGVDQLIQILEKKQNELSCWCYIDRLGDPPVKADSISLDLTQVFALVTEGMRYQAHMNPNPTEMVVKDFQIYVRNRTNWNPFTTAESREWLTS